MRTILSALRPASMSLGSVLTFMQEKLSTPHAAVLSSRRVTCCILYVLLYQEV